MNKFFRSIKDNNKGMSLIEAIVAAAILSAAVIPLIYCFAFAPKMNARAKIKQRATNAAVSVMETFKAYNLESISESIANGSFGSDYGYVCDSASAPSDGSLYGEYTITNLKFSDGTEPKSYNVSIDVSKPREASIGETPLFNSHWDVMFVEDRTVCKNYDPYEAINSIISSHLSKAETENAKVEAHREIYIDILDTGSVEIEYKYKGKLFVDSGEIAFTYDSSNDSNLKQILSIDPIVDEEDNAITSLRNIYFYFYPCYKDRFKTSTTDVDVSVKFTNEQFYLSNNYTPNTLHGINGTNIFLFKQRNNSRFLTTDQLVSAETNYKAQFLATKQLKKNIYVYDVINKLLSDLEGSNSTFILTDDYYNTDLDVIDLANKENVIMKSFSGEESTKLLFPSNVVVTVSSPTSDGGGDDLVSVTGSLLR